jgi:hypothetical protein
MFPIPRLSMYLAVALALALFGMAFHMQRAARFQAQARETAQVALTLRAALDAQNKVAEECNASAEALFAIATDQSKKVEAAVAIANTYRDQLIATREALQIQQETDRAIPECQALLGVDLVAVCPGYANGVRVRARLQGQSDKSPGAGAR